MLSEVAVVAPRQVHRVQRQNGLREPPDLQALAVLHAALLVAARRVPPSDPLIVLVFYPAASSVSGGAGDYLAPLQTPQQLRPDERNQDKQCGNQFQIIRI